MRRVAAELGLGTMSLYHYVRGKDELLDLMSDEILGRQLVDDAELHKGWRAGLRAIAVATRRNFERHPWIIGAIRPRPRAVPGPNSLRHFDQSVAAVADLDVDLKTRMEIVTLIDDYVFGFSVRADIAGLEERIEQAEAGWMQAVFDYMAGELETGAYPNVQRIVDENRAAGGKDEDLSAMALDQGRFERGLERVLDGIAAELERKAPKQRRGR
jgi:AcrR family transcriptional regulator